MSKYFNVTVKDLGKGNDLCIIDIDKIDSKLESYLDNKFVKICEGNSGANLQYVKKRLISFLTTKKGSTLELGAIAEFLIHLYLNDSGFEPQFLYMNLEENSIKKGFDGYYFYDGEEWILESKSGSITTAGITHANKIKESYEDLKTKLSGGAANNPWQNAYNHASHVDVGANSSVRENIKSFSKQYEEDIRHKIDDFNIIPGSTIFLDGKWIASKPATIESEIKAAITKFKFKKIKVVCITKKSLETFWDYLNKL